MTREIADLEARIRKETPPPGSNIGAAGAGRGSGSHQEEDDDVVKRVDIQAVLKQQDKQQQQNNQNSKSNKDSSSTSASSSSSSSSSAGALSKLSYLSAFRTFEELPLSGRTKKALADAGFKHLTKIQRGAIPHALAGRDVVGQVGRIS